MEIEKINNAELIVKVYQGQRVVTFKDIDMVHERPEGTANRNFRENKDKFIENEDYFCITKCQNNEIRGLEIPNRGITVVTEQGYLMLVKSFTDDLAWDVQRKLVKSYFRRQGQNTRKLPKLISMDEIEEKEPFVRLYRTENGGIVLMNGEVYSLLSDEIDHLSRFVSELEKQNIEQIQYIVSAFLRSMKISGKLEEIASWGIK